MNGNAELLNFVYQNAQMGVDTIKQLADIVEDSDMAAHLGKQYDEYKCILDSAKSLLNNGGYDEKGIGAFDKAKTYLMVNIQTLKDKSASHIAEMLIIGSNMGIIQAIRNLKKYRQAEPDIVELMKKLLDFEENNVRRLKAFL